MLIKNVNHIKLLSEFDVTNIAYDKQNINNTMQYDSNNEPLSAMCDLEITFTDGVDMTLVQSIIDAHEPTPIAPAPSEVEILKEQVASQQAIIDELLFEVIPSLLVENEEVI